MTGHTARTVDMLLIRPLVQATGPASVTTGQFEGRTPQRGSASRWVTTITDTSEPQIEPIRDTNTDSQLRDGLPAGWESIVGARPGRAARALRVLIRSAEPDWSPWCR